MRLLMMKGMVQLLQHFHFLDDNAHNANESEKGQDNDNVMLRKSMPNGDKSTSMKKASQQARILYTL